MPVQRPAAVRMEVIASLMIAKCLLTVLLPPDWAIITAIKMLTRNLVVGMEVTVNKKESVVANDRSHH